MKHLLSRIAVLGSLALASNTAYAVICVDQTCERPGFSAATQSGWSISASGVSGVKSLVSVGPTGNQVGSQYYFGVSNSDLGATIANGGFTPGGSGARVISTAFQTNASQTPSVTVFGGSVQQILGNTAYFFYAQACPSGTGIYNSAGCSAWTQIGTATTSPYPVSVFAAPVAPGDATTNSINGRAAVPAADTNNVSLVRLEIRDLINAANNQILSPIGWPGNGAFPIDNTMYTLNGGFKPNVKYEYRGQVDYPFGISVPTAGPQTRGPFWTRPATPGTVSASNVTHCSAQITATNASGSPANPSYTTYNLCASGTGGSCLTDGVSGGNPGDIATITIVNLMPGTPYTPTGQALVGNGDGSSAGWNPSVVRNGTGFTTAGFAGTFSITAISANSANFTFSGLDLTGVTAYQMVVNGADFGAQVNSTPVSPVTLSGLTPNTQYQVQIRLIEASCNSTVPSNPVTAGTQFYTLPAAPIAPASLTAPTPRSMSASWSDPAIPAGNPNGSEYTVQTCTTGFGTGTCQTQTATKASTTPSATISSGILPETLYFVRVKTVSASGNSANDSAWLNINSITTPNEAPTINSITHTVFTSSATLSASVTDNGPAGELVYHWSVTAAPSGAVTSFTLNNSNSANPTVINFNPSGSYTVQLVVTDKNDTGLSDTDTDTFSPGQSPSSITIAPNSATVVTGNGQLFTATVRDQFNQVIAGQAVTWGGVGACGTLSNPNPAVSITFTATTPGSCNLTATLTGVTPGSASITVQAAGPVFTTQPTLTMNADGVTGIVSARATDNVTGAGSVVYTWTLESGPSAVSFSPNNSNAAQDATATFSKAGSYILRCTVTSSGISQFALTPSVTVNQILTSIKVCPTGQPSCDPLVTVVVKALVDHQFTPYEFDQFDDAMINPLSVTWSGNGVNSAGVFNSSTLGSQITITATAAGNNGPIRGSALVSVIDFNVSNAYASPVPYKASTGNGFITFRNLGSQSTIHIYTPSGRRVFDISLTATTYDWYLQNSSGENIASGVYSYVIESPEGKKNGKLIIIR